MGRIGMKAKTLLLSAIPLFLFFFCYEAPAQLTKMNVGYVGINSDNVIAFIAKETGIFAKNGLDVQGRNNTPNDPNIVRDGDTLTVTKEPTDGNT